VTLAQSAACPTYFLDTSCQYYYVATTEPMDGMSECITLMVPRGKADSQRHTSPPTRKRRTQRARIRRRRGCRDTVAQRTLPCMKQPKDKTITPACVAQLGRQWLHMGKACAAKKRGSVSCTPTRDGCGSVIPTWQHHSVQQVLQGEYIPNLVRDSSYVTTHVRSRITPSVRSPATLHRACTLHTLAYAIDLIRPPPHPPQNDKATPLRTFRSAVVPPTVTVTGT
jgi:hypothetical protein